MPCFQPEHGVTRFLWSCGRNTLSGFKQYTPITVMRWGSVVQTESAAAEIKVWAGLFASGSSRGESVSPISQLLEAVGNL